MSDSRKEKKIVLVGISLAGGGAERMMALQSKMLTELGHEVHLVVLNDKVSYEYQGELFNLGKYKSVKDGLLSRLMRFQKFRSYLKRQQFDFIIDHRAKNNYYREWYYHKYLYRGFKCIYVVHNFDKHNYLTEVPKKGVKLYNANYKTISVSDTIRKDLLIKNGVNNTLTIYNTFQKPLNTNIATPEIIKGKKYILSYGRIDEKAKNYSFLIDAYCQSKLYENEVYLVIMGDGEDKIFLQEKVKKLNLDNKIIFMPRNDNPFHIVKESITVTLTSNYEGFPMVLLEAFAYGIPIVSVDIKSGPSEIIVHQKNGLLIANHDKVAFANALQKMCLDEDFYQNCIKNIPQSIEKFSYEKIKKDWSELLS